MTYTELLAQWWGQRETTHGMPPSKWRMRLAGAVVRRGWPPVDQAGPPPVKGSRPAGASAKAIRAVLDAHAVTLLRLLEIADVAFGVVVAELVASRAVAGLSRSDVAEKVVTLLLHAYLHPTSPWPPDVPGDDVPHAGGALAKTCLRELRDEAAPTKMSATAFAERWTEGYDALWTASADERAEQPSPRDLLLAVADRPPLVDAHSSPTRLAPGARRAHARKDWSVGLDRPVYFRYEGYFDGRRLRPFRNGSFVDEDKLRCARRVPPDADRISVATSCEPLGVSIAAHREVLAAVHDALVRFLPERTAHDPWEKWLASATATGWGAPELLRPALADQVHRWRRARILREGDVVDPPDPPSVGRIMRQCWFLLHRSELSFPEAIVARMLAINLKRFLDAERHPQEAPLLDAPAPSTLTDSETEVGAAIDTSAQARQERCQATARILHLGFADQVDVLLTPPAELSAADRRRRERTHDRYAAMCDEAARSAELCSPWMAFVSPAQWAEELDGLRSANDGLLAAAQGRCEEGQDG